MFHAIVKNYSFLVKYLLFDQKIVSCMMRFIKNIIFICQLKLFFLFGKYFFVLIYVFLFNVMFSYFYYFIFFFTY